MASEYKQNTLHLIGSSAIAGLVTRIFLHPIDTCKVKIQVDSSTGPRSGILGTALQMLRTEGPLGFYRGFIPAVAGTIPGVCLYFGSYQFFKDRMEDFSGATSSHIVNFTAGFLAETVSCVVWVPTDVVKERAQASLTPSGVPRSAGSSHLRAIVSQEGIRGLYRGYGATLASFGPFSALYFMFVEPLKSAAQRLRGGSELSFPDLVAVCAAAGGAAAFFTAPMDLVKVRMQVESASTSTYSGFLSTLGHTFRNEGLRGLFRGGGSRVWFAAPNTAITMAVMESIKYRLANAAETASES